MKLFIILPSALCVAFLAAQTPAPKAAEAGGKPAPSLVPRNNSAAAYDKVILTIGDTKLTVGQFDQLVEALPENVRASARGPNKRMFLEQLIRVELMAQEARRRKLEQKPAVQMQLKLQTDNALASALFQEISTEGTISPEAARKYYDEHIGDYEQARARHILIRVKGSQMPPASGKKELSEEEALAKVKELREKIAAGADFATVAKAESDDAGSAVNGGDLGSFTRGKMVPQFEQVAFSLPVGQISEPVKTQFGYHIIKVDQREAKTFDELKPDIEKRMRADMARQTMDNLRKNSAVIIDESYFAVAPPAAGTPPPAVK